MFDHLTQELPIDCTKAKWIVDNRRLVKLVYNKITTKTEDNTIHYQTIKELWESIESLYFGKDNLHQVL